MKKINKLVWVLSFCFFLEVGCSKDRTAPVSNPPTNSTETNLIKLEDALQLSDTDFVNLIKKVRGSVGTNVFGSKVIWSRKNNYSLGLFLSANHVYGIGTWTSLNEEFIDLAVNNNGIFIGSKIPQVNGNINLTNELIANFGLYHPQIPANSTNANILPKDDFYLGIIDNQRIIDNGLGNYPNIVQTTVPLQMYDPNNRTRATQTWSVSNNTELVVAIGYPQDKSKYPNGAVASGKVYSDSEAENIIQLLNQKGDEEGNIPYNPNVEFLAKVDFAPGMSGGGVFNSQGQLLGVIVRGTKLNGEPVLRIVRITYIKQKITNFYNSLSVADKNKLKPYISGEVN